MTKSELTEKMADQVGQPITTTKAVVETILGAMTDTLEGGEGIEIRGFGSFSIKNYGAYTGRNPRTAARVAVEPKKLPVFKVGKELRERVNRGRRQA